MATSIKATGKTAGQATGQSTVTFVDALRMAIDEEMARDDRVFILGEDIGVYGGAFKVTDGLLAKYGAERVLDTPISETANVGTACGAALMGLRPIVEFQFIDFIACAFDIIVNYAAKLHWRNECAMPIVLRGPCGGNVHGGPFHSQNPEASFMSIPGLKIVEPSTAYDARGLLKSAIRDDDPVIFLEHKYLYRLPRVKADIPNEEYLVPLGKAALRRQGRDLSIITYGAMCYTALDAAEKMAAEGIEIEVLDLRTLLPLDKEAIRETVARTNRVMILHEATRTGGLAGEICMQIMETAFEHLDAPVARVASMDTPVPYSPTLEEEFMPQVSDVEEAARKLLSY